MGPGGTIRATPASLAAITFKGRRIPSEIDAGFEKRTIEFL